MNYELSIKLVPQGVPVFTLLLAPEEWVSPRQSNKGSGVGIYSITISRLSVQSFFIVALPVEPRLCVPWMSMNEFCNIVLLRFFASANLQINHDICKHIWENLENDFSFLKTQLFLSS